MGMSTVPLSDLYAGARTFLEPARRAFTLTRTSSRRRGMRRPRSGPSHTRAGALASDFLVLALPFEATAKLLPRHAAAAGVNALAAQIARHDALAHLQRASVVRPRDHGPRPRRAARPRDSLDVQQERFQPGRRRREVISNWWSAPRALCRAQPRAGDRAGRRRAGRIFSRRRSARLEKAALVKEVRATFGVPPGIDAARPPPVSPWPNCFLAGDWMATGWPSTMESAARSGHLAAEAVRALRAPRRHLSNPT